MNCRDLSEFLGDYFAGDLPAGVSTEFELHVSRCGNCERFLVQYRETIALGRSASHQPCEVPEDLIQAIITSLKSAE